MCNEPLLPAPALHLPKRILFFKDRVLLKTKQLDRSSSRL
jgi:hypothetical protein